MITGRPQQNPKNRKILALIPARAGSKRIKDKNIRLLNGIPLFRWSEATAILSGLFDKIILSTDSDEYAKMSMVEVLIRPPELCRDESSDYDVISHCLSHYPGCDLLAYLRPTTPFRAATLIGEVIQTMIDAGDNASGLRSVEEMSESAYKCFRLEFGRLIPAIVSRGDMTDIPNQECPKTYRPNGYVDVIKAEIVKNGALWGDKKIGFVTPKTIEIDTEADLLYAQWWATHRMIREEVIWR